MSNRIVNWAWDCWGIPRPWGRATGSEFSTLTVYPCVRCVNLNPQRLIQARQDFPQVKAYETSEAFSGDKEVDVVIVTTPPNTHAKMCIQMMETGKHVVCEKPLTLTWREANAMVEMAEKQHVHLS